MLVNMDLNKNQDLNDWFEGFFKVVNYAAKNVRLNKIDHINLFVIVY